MQHLILTLIAVSSLPLSASSSADAIQPIEDTITELEQNIATAVKLKTRAEQNKAIPLRQQVRLADRIR